MQLDSPWNIRRKEFINDFKSSSSRIETYLGAEQRALNAGSQTDTLKIFFKMLVLAGPTQPTLN